jgi:hypothetical protein
MRYYRQYRGEKLHAYEDRSGRLVITDQAYLP